MAKPLIAVETIYERVLKLLDRDGVNGLQARRLARALKCSTRTLYEQVGKRETLIRQLLAHHFARLELDFQAEATWQASATHWAFATRNALLVHPNLTRLMAVEDRGVVVRYVNLLLKVLLQADFPAELAMRCCRVLNHTVISLTLVELETPPAAERRRHRSWREIRFENLLLAERSTASQTETFQDTPEVFQNAIRWLIDGVEKELAAVPPVFRRRTHASSASRITPTNAQKA